MARSGKWQKNLERFKTTLTFGHDLIYVQESSRSFWLYRPNLRDIIRGVRESVCVCERVCERERERKREHLRLNKMWFKHEIGMISRIKSQRCIILFKTKKLRKKNAKKTGTTSRSRIFFWYDDLRSWCRAFNLSFDLFAAADTLIQNNRRAKTIGHSAKAMAE